MKDILPRVWDGKRYWYPVFSELGITYQAKDLPFTEENIKTLDWAFGWHFELNSLHFDWCLERPTCLKDKNGNLIYEGDIVDTFYEGEPTGQRYIYRYEPPAFYVEPFENGKPSEHHYYYFAVANERCEIIGNIHENGDLLK